MGTGIDPDGDRMKFAHEETDLTISDKGQKVDQDKIIKWLDDHKKDIALVLVTALVTTKYNARRNGSGANAILQTQDGSVWVLPAKNG